MSGTITLSRAEILEPLNSVAALAETRTTIAVLAFVRLDVHEDTVSLCATDMDMWIKRDIKLNTPVDVTMSICIEAARFADIVRKLPADAIIEISLLENSMCRLKAGKSKYDLPTLPADDLPIPTRRTATALFSMDAAVLADLLEKTKYCVSRDETRHYMKGAHFFVDNGNICMEGTDGHRCSKLPTSLPAESEFNIIIPIDAASHMIKMLSAGGNAHLEISEWLIILTMENVRFTSKLVDGQFPDINRIAPTQFDSEFIVNRRELLKSCERINVFMPREKASTVKISTQGDRFILSSNDNLDSGTEEMESACISGADSLFGVNIKYLMEALSVMGGDEVTFRVDKSLICLVDSGQPEAIYIIMAVRL